LGSGIANMWEKFAPYA